MRLGLNLGYWGMGNDSDNLVLAKEADKLGYSVVWAAEAYGSDAATVLAFIAAQTETIDVGSAVFQIPGRTPANTAMTAATLDTLSNGRFRLGLGVSGPQVSEGWHGKALPLSVHPVREYIPIYLAAVGPSNLELAGEIADGWLAIFYSPEYAAEHRAGIEAGRAKVGKTMDGFDVVATVPVVIGDDVDACAVPLRNYSALYLGGMGSRDTNFYNQLAVRMGYDQAAAAVQDLYLGRDYAGAAAAVPFDFIDKTALIGRPARIQDRLHAYADAGVSTLSVATYAETIDERLATLRQMAEILDASGLGD